MKLPTQKTLLSFAVAALLFLSVLALIRNSPMVETKVTVAPATQADLTPEIFGVGTIEARRAYLIGPTLASRVTQVLVDQGDAVKTGQLLAALDPIDLDERFDSAGSAKQRATSAAEGAEAQLREAASRHAVAAASATRFRELRQQGFVSQEATDAKQHEANAAVAAREAAQAALTAARRDVARLDSDRAGIAKQRAQYRLKSPIDGLITSREAEPGSTVIAGQAVLRLIDPASLWIKARIDQGRAAGIALGQPVQILLRSRPGQIFPGKVARIDAVSDSVTEERLVAITFDNPPTDISIGELVEVTIRLPSVRNAVTIPTAAIRHIQQQSGVWRIEDGKARFVTIRTGVQTLAGQTQVLEGLAAGVTVIHHTVQELKGGERVRVVDGLVPGNSGS
ncbi:MAG: efflux RND transporter periplasmic adaptor subunit [Proteobacteria bacterium]|nr:efflux RND transporter periplasmic adaptor subunit [Pseudomonadota bacterium]